jgi:hypothetical protein
MICSLVKGHLQRHVIVVGYGAYGKTIQEEAEWVRGAGTFHSPP